MKVLLFNGSPHKNGCTYTALEEIAKTLKEEEIDSEIYQIGTKSITPCRGCYACKKIGKCVINDDDVNNFIEYAKNFDGFIFGSPVHYGSACGGITAFLDRAFFSAFQSGRGDIFIHKPGAAVVSARRSGTTAALDQLNKYFAITQMPMISGRYWNMVHGTTPDEVRQDVEGMQNMRILARNMAWHLKCQEAGDNAGIPRPEMETVTFTNFIKKDDYKTKNLVAYFSRAGEQTAVGEIFKGNTAIVAELIADKIGADLFEIKVIDDQYPDKYADLLRYTRQEKQNNARPDIEGSVPNFEHYENIFLGYPNWWGDMPMPVYTFLDQYNFEGKKIYHFCTHEGSGGIDKNGFELEGHIAQYQPEKADEKLTEWLKSLHI